MRSTEISIGIERAGFYKYSHINIWGQSRVKDSPQEVVIKAFRNFNCFKSGVPSLFVFTSSFNKNIKVPKFKISIKIIKTCIELMCFLFYLFYCDLLNELGTANFNKIIIYQNNNFHIWLKIPRVNRFKVFDI